MADTANHKSTDDLRREIGDRIRAARVKRGMSSDELGQKMGIHRLSQERRESGTYDLRVIDLIRYAEVFGVKPAELIKGL